MTFRNDPIRSSPSGPRRFSNVFIVVSTWTHFYVRTSADSINLEIYRNVTVGF